MSKYYKAEDVFDFFNIADCIVDKDKLIIDMKNGMPTIEVSEDCVSRKWLLNYISKGNQDDFMQAVLVERPKGKWIKNVDGNYECSECHVAIRGYDKPLYNFCAWCGADLRGSE